MPWSRPRSASGSSRSSLDAVASTVAPARLASWIAAMPTPPAPAWMSDGLAVGQPAELEEAVVARCRTRPARRRPRPMSRPSGTGHVVARGDGDAARRASHGSWSRRPGRPTARSVTSSPTATIVPAAWYPTMCGSDSQRRPPDPVEGVAALDADGLDLDERRRPVPTSGSGTSSYRRTSGRAVAGGRRQPSWSLSPSSTTSAAARSAAIGRSPYRRRSRIRCRRRALRCWYGPSVHPVWLPLTSSPRPGPDLWRWGTNKRQS